MEGNEVDIALEILLEEIEMVANATNEKGAKAFQRHDYEAARQVIEEGTRVAEFRQRVRTLQQEWQAQFAAAVRRHKGIKRHKGVFRKLGRGLRTPDDVFRWPTLEALVELGGSAKMGQVLDRVGSKMKGTLNKYDYEALPSDPKQKRWKNTVQWCRYTMVLEGLLKKATPRGTWEISEAGRRFLARERSARR